MRLDEKKTGKYFHKKSLKHFKLKAQAKAKKV